MKKGLTRSFSKGRTSIYVMKVAYQNNDEMIINQLHVHFGINLAVNPGVMSI